MKFPGHPRKIGAVVAGVGGFGILLLGVFSACSNMSSSSSGMGVAAESGPPGASGAPAGSSGSLKPAGVAASTAPPAGLFAGTWSGKIHATIRSTGCGPQSADCDPMGLTLNQSDKKLSGSMTCVKTSPVFGSVAASSATITNAHSCGAAGNSKVVFACVSTSSTTFHCAVSGLTCDECPVGSGRETLAPISGKASFYK